MKSYSNPTGAAAKKAIQKICEELKEHVAMVYQRFLDPAFKEAKNIKITIAGENILPWDPFVKKESDRVAYEIVEVPNADASFSVSAYVLPRKEEFSSQEAFQSAKLRNNLQGFYVYRENRLIHFADWLGMYTQEPHGTLLRVEFTFDHRLDDAFQIDIKKSQINLDPNLYNWLADQFLPAPRRAADDRYRQGQKKKAHAQAVSAHLESNNNISSKQLQIQGAEVVASGKNDEAIIKNAQGEFRFKLKITNSQKDGEVFIQPVEGLNDGVFFEPALIDNQKGVRINTTHPYYHKVYLPNLKSGVTIQGMDSLLWALCMAEFSTIDQNTLDHFDQLRFELSRILRKLVADLPEPTLNEDEI